MVAVAILTYAVRSPAATQVFNDGGSHDIAASTTDSFTVTNGSVLNVDSGVSIGDSSASNTLDLSGTLNLISGAIATGNWVGSGTGAQFNLGTLGSGAPAVVNGEIDSIAGGVVTLDNVHINANGDGQNGVAVEDGGALTSTQRTVVEADHVGIDLQGLSVTGDINGSQVTGGDVGVRELNGATVKIYGGAAISGGAAGLFVDSGSSAEVHGGKIHSTGARGLSDVFDSPVVNSAGVVLVSTPPDVPALPEVSRLTIDSGANVVADGDSSAALLVVSRRDSNSVTGLIADSSLTGGQYGVAFMHDSTFDNFGTQNASASVVFDHAKLSSSAGAAIISTANTDNTVTFQNNSTVHAGDGNLAITDAGSSLHLNIADSALSGNVINQGMTEVNLHSGAALTGMMGAVTRATIDGGAKWTMSGNSTVNNLSMNGGTVDLGGQGNAFHTLTVESLDDQGGKGGQFDFGTSLLQANPAGDLLNVTGVATGQYLVHINDSGADLGGKGRPLTVVETGGGAAGFTLDSPDQRVNRGTFQYRLVKTESNSWVLQQTSTPTPFADTIINTLGVAPTIWYGQTITLRERLGELGFVQDKGGVWVRPYGSEMDVSSATGHAYDQNQSGVALGADKAFDALGGKIFVGGVFNYSRSSLDDHAGANGTVDAYSIGTYAAWLNDAGYYLHGLINFNRYIDQAQAVTLNGGAARGSTSSSGIGMSLEGGRRFNMPYESFVQPYAQVSALHMTGSNLSLNNGMSANNDGPRSLQAAMGVQLGKDFHNARGDSAQPYLRVAVVHEFVKGNAVSVNGHSFNNDLSGSRLELGLGVDVQMGKHFSTHIDYSYAEGHKMRQPYFLNAGLRYQW